jgi:RimJ/RimL family protein N-acetyltransferase
MTEEPTVCGEFVTLRPLSQGDADVTFVWRQSERARLLNDGAQSLEQQREWIRSRPASERNFVIELRDGRSIGMLSLIEIDLPNRRAQSARFLIGEPDAVRGVPAAVEAMKLLYDLAFDTLGLERVWGTVAAENRMMAKWQKYLGMIEEGRLRRHYRFNDRYQDAICFGILADEYRMTARPRMEALIGAARRHPPQVADA